MTPDDFFAGHPESLALFEAVCREVAKLGEATMRVAKSQVAFRRRRNFAVVWMPGQYLHGPGAPLVLTLSFPEPDDSPRWKEVARSAPRRYTHHLELRKKEEIDAEVRSWLRRAWEAA